MLPSTSSGHRGVDLSPRTMHIEHVIYLPHNRQDDVVVVPSSLVEYLYKGEDCIGHRHWRIYRVALIGLPDV